MKWFLILFIFLSCKETTIIEQTESAPKIDNSKKEEQVSCSYDSLSENLRTPRTINETVDLINALPKPLKINCFLRSLRRPLRVNMTLSKLSAQPAVGNNSPRVFIFIDNLVLSIVPEGPGKDLLELSEMYSDSKSLKSELIFPINENITYQTGYDRILSPESGGTTCGSCHNYESEDTTINEVNGFTSTALKPQTVFTISQFYTEVYSCEGQANINERCEIILGLGDQGDLIEAAFPENTPTWLDSIL